MFTAEQFVNLKGRFVTMEQTIADFKVLLSGELDHLPEAAFYMVGTLEEAQEKAKKLLEN
jgi:F-type H+-transporting ATPase subunit beta